MSPVVFRHVGVLLHLFCGFQDKIKDFFLDTSLDRRDVVRHCQEADTRAPACLLTGDTGLSPIPMIHGSTLDMHESSPTTLGSCESTCLSPF